MSQILTTNIVNSQQKNPNHSTKIPNQRANKRSISKQVAQKTTLLSFFKPTQNSRLEFPALSRQTQCSIPPNSFEHITKTSSESFIGKRDICGLSPIRDESIHKSQKFASKKTSLLSQISTFADSQEAAFSNPCLLQSNFMDEDTRTLVKQIGGVSSLLEESKVFFSQKQDGSATEQKMRPNIERVCPQKFQGKISVQEKSYFGLTQNYQNICDKL